MTTIAYADGVIAYDSRMVYGDMVMSDNHNKALRRNGVAFVVSGPAFYPEFLAAYFGDRKLRHDMAGILVKGRRPWLFGVDHDGFIFEQVLESPWAMGSGAEYALGAMDFGASPAEAVSIAIGRDTHSGGRILTLEVS